MLMTTPQGLHAFRDETAARPASAPGPRAPAGQIGPVLATCDGLPATGLPARVEVLTAAGLCRVRDLRPGQRVITRDRGFCALRATLQRHATSALVEIAAGAFGPGCPEVTLWLPETQPILLRAPRASGRPQLRQRMVPLGHLVDGRRIRALATTGPQSIITLAFDEPHVIYAAGLELLAATAAPVRAAAP